MHALHSFFEGIARIGILILKFLNIFLSCYSLLLVFLTHLFVIIKVFVFFKDDALKF
jgi:hypothetical protein